MSERTRRRILKEILQITKEPPQYCFVELAGDDLFTWKAKIQGPPGTPYEKGVFVLYIILPKNYPFQPPLVAFDTMIYHPNICSRYGFICMNVLSDEWNPLLTVSDVLVAICLMLCDPKPYNPVNADSATNYLEDREKFNQIAKEWTQKYA